MTESFNASRLTLARRRRGMTKTALAKRVGVDARSVAAWENSEYIPEPDKLSRLSSILNFPTEFFFGQDLERPVLHQASFRSMTSMTAAQRDMALGAGAIAFHLNRWIEERFELPGPRVPNLGELGSPETAAEALRREWSLGELPIKNMVHLLESRGVRVYTLAIDAAEVDAFSLWRGATPFILLNTQKSSERSRMDAAHELGHLVLHQHGEPHGQEAEAQANAFASAFLMPRASVLAKAPRFATLDHLMKLKKYWNVSVAALTVRLHALKVLSEWHYRKLMIDISSRGFRTFEPEPAPRESSQVLVKVFNALREEHIAKDDIAGALRIPVEEIDELMFGLAMTALPGSGIASSAPRGNLQLVGKR